MKTLFHIHSLNTEHPSVVMSQHNFNAPNPALPDMLRALNPDVEIFTSVDHLEENDVFMHKNIIFETIKHFKNVDGYITDQIFTDNHHHIDSMFVNELSKLIGDRHFIIGPSFSKIPYFRQSQILDELIEYDVSGVMFDIRHIDFNNYSELQPLAKLKIHAKKRIEIIPVVSSEEKRDELTKSIPFDMVYIHP
ncbi:hypothetical protein [Lacicoccus qingdaonensis]|uniref:Uncharacterized protein n=1 Tax=Lacicoccus qingdaonensis TaxID=576118 RepID=A0A1G9E1L6_9BACL|nr:hypothetical protein [Salinicoccus qingdaonensis]SDK69968.1 hypothetical protein SAMN05216216_10757 [Salinicoccus qingdaonensis]